METITEEEECAKKDEASDEDDVVLFIENKFCSACHLEMPLRTKHCKDCDQCVATHDHHCPWVNNCIGELNVKQFYIYLFLQAAQLINGLSIAATVLLRRNQREEVTAIGSDTKQASNLAIYFVTLAMAFLLAFVGALIFLHTYLISKGLTSWEYLSWMNITYLKVWPRRLGSPFSKGSRLANFKDFIRTRPGLFDKRS